MVRDHSSKTKSEAGLGQRWIVMIVVVVLWGSTEYVKFVSFLLISIKFGLKVVRLFYQMVSIYI